MTTKKINLSKLIYNENDQLTENDDDNDRLIRLDEDEFIENWQSDVFEYLAGSSRH